MECSRRCGECGARVLACGGAARVDGLRLSCGQVLGIRSRYGTPTVGVLLSAAGVIALSRLDFTAIIELVNILYVFAELIEFAAFVKLRADFPDQRREFAIPVRTPLQAALFFMPATIFLLAIVFFSSTQSLVICGVSLFMSVVVYVGTCAAREKGWCEFNSVDDTWSPKKDPRCAREERVKAQDCFA